MGEAHPGAILVGSRSLSGEIPQLEGKLKDQGCTVQFGDVRALARGSLVGLTVSDAGIASTGTLLCVEVDEDSRLASMLADVHIALVDAASIVSCLGEVNGLLQNAFDGAPGFVAMISGPSRTADIERELTIGVHGPRVLHILVLDERTLS